MPIDTQNKFMVGVQGDRIVVLNPPRSLTKDDAILLAAYLVALAGETEHSFEAVLTAVQNT